MPKYIFFTIILILTSCKNGKMKSKFNQSKQNEDLSLVEANRQKENIFKQRKHDYNYFIIIICINYNISVNYC